MLRLLADENVPRLLIVRLREHGHEVRWVREDSRGVTDPQVLELAMRESRILLTLDKDFGELVFRRGKTATCGVILVRLTAPSQGEFVARVLPLLEANDARWSGHFAVVGPRQIRMVPLPT